MYLDQQIHSCGTGVYFFLFCSSTNNVSCSITTLILGIEGKHADHLTITRAQSDLTGFLRGFGNFVKTLEQLLQQFLLTNFASEESWQCWRQKSSKNCKNCCHFLLGVQCRLREQYYKRFFCYQHCCNYFTYFAREVSLYCWPPVLLVSNRLCK